jgi:hypothetical protein
VNCQKILFNSLITTGWGVLFFVPKNVNALADIYSPWVSLGGYCDVDVLDVNICLRSVAECYYSRTKLLHRGPDQALFIAAHASRDGLRHGLSSDRIRNVVGIVMTAAGVPSKFRPHSPRHAFLADAATRGWHQEDFLADALLSGRVYDLYYKCPVEQVVNHVAMVPFVGNSRGDPPVVRVELSDRRLRDIAR